MTEVCVSVNDEIFCSSGEMLFIVFFIEVLIYLAIFGGVFAFLRRFLIKKYRKEEEEWNPYRRDN